MENYLLALELNEKTGDKKSKANILGNIGLYYQMESNYPKALEYLLKVLKLFEELEDDNGMLTQYTNIGSLYQQIADYKKALFYDSIGLTLAKKLQSIESEASILGNIGNVYSDLKQFNQAFIYKTKAVSLYKKLGQKEGEARNLSNISTDFDVIGDYKKAIQYQQQALTIFEDIDLAQGIGISQMNIGEYYYKMVIDPRNPITEKNNPPKSTYLNKAIELVKKGISVVDGINDLSMLSFGHQVLAQCYKENGQYKEAFESYIQYTNIKDSIFNTERTEILNNLTHQREIELKESKIKLLAQDVQLKQIQTQKANLTRNALIIGIILVLIASSYIVLYYKRKQQAAKLLADEKINTLLKDQELQSVSNMLDAQEQERKRIAADLHDRLGSMLSTVKLYFNSVEVQIDQLREQNRTQYQKATSLLDEACDEVRKISHNLVSGELVKFGLVSALNQLRDTINGTGKLTMEVHAFGMDKRLDTNAEIALYRVVQELLNNILKHAQASHVVIQLNKIENNLNIVVEDNGVGFDVDAAKIKGGLGLRSVETRVQKLGGTINFDSGKGSGTTTIIDLPFVE
jgi:signal transduction histidine kinase